MRLSLSPRPARECPPGRSAALGATRSVDVVWAWGDLMNGLQIFPNLIGVIGLSGLVATMLREDRATRSAGAP